MKREYFRQVLVSATGLELVGLISALTYWALGEHHLAWAIAAAMAAVPIGLWAVGWKRNRSASAHLIATTILITVALTSASNGGLAEPGHTWLYTVPLLAGLIGGARTLVLWSVVTLATLLSLSAGHLGPLAVHTVLPPERMPLLRIANVVLLAVTFGLLIYAFLRNRRLAEEEAATALQKLSAEVEERRVAEERAKAADRAKSVFLATMSHEIRTPMNGVLGMAELLLDLPLGEQERRFAEIIQASGESLLSLLNDILDYSKIEAGRMELDHQDFDLERVAEDALTLISGRAREKKLELILDVEPEVSWRVRGDGARLRQVLLNLLGNAVKFTDQGEVELVLRRRAAAPGRVGLELSVRDSGVGIAPSALQRLFAPFVQADPSVAQRYGGTGLGLAISRRIVELMGGQIRVESTPGGGSTFLVDLELEGNAATAEASPAVRRVEVLLLEDHPKTRAVLIRQLNALGAQVEVAEGLAQAQALLRARRFDRVVCDRRRGEADLAEDAKGLATFYGAKVVLLCEWGDGLAPEDQGPLVAQLTKPITRHALRTLLAPDLPAGPTGPRWSEQTIQANAPLVLVVDDNPVNRKVASMYLQRLGYQSVEAEDGATALARLDASIAVVLMDIEMPGLSGYEATGLIRARPDALARVPVIALTAHAMAGYREQVLAASMDDYLTKPLRRPELAAALERALGPGPNNPPLGGRQEGDARVTVSG